MAVPERVRELLEEFAQVQARPITDPALIERMRSEATTWINAVHMQHRRAKNPHEDDVWRQEIDLYFLLVALTRLRRAVGLATRVAELQDPLLDRLIEFDRAIPSLTTLRNVAEHFDDYTTGKGRAANVKRHQLQVWGRSSGHHGRRGGPTSSDVAMMPGGSHAAFGWLVSVPASWANVGRRSDWWAAARLSILWMRSSWPIWRSTSATESNRP